MLNNTCLSRREMLRSSVAGFGYVALCGLCTELAAAENQYQNPLSPKAPHFHPRAKRVIFLTMRGGPSHVDTFDYKPALERDHGKTVNKPGDTPASSAKFFSRPLLKSPWKFAKNGESGLLISELYPKLAQHADELCVLNGMHTTVPNHAPAFLIMHTGESRFVRPSLGSWLLYGLGTENQDLPGFISISPPEQFGGAQNYGSAFLPAIYQGTAYGAAARRVADAQIGNLKNTASSKEEQRKQLDLVQWLNRDFLAEQQVMPELEGVIESLELGFRMQSTLPQVTDLSMESRATLAMYGISAGRAGRPGKGSGATDDFGRQCLLARRFLEAGVRFVEVCHEGWDQHNNLQTKLSANCASTDQPIAALLTDLKQRGMLQDTLVVWGGEFGRTPTSQGDDGRDHNSTGFSMWLAGGGSKGGLCYGATDEHGFAAVENPMHVNDLHATILHLLGLDHTKLTYRFGGRDYRLTNVGGEVAKAVIA